MVEGIHEVKIEQDRGHWIVHINGDFFCSADTYNEAIKELRKTYG